MIDIALLDDFMRRFFGYGSWNARLWFVGMEEGGGGTSEEIEKRIAAWDRSDDLADLKVYHKAIGGFPWFSQRPKIQSTWSKLIRVVLAAPPPSTGHWLYEAFGLPSIATRELYERSTLPVRIRAIRDRIERHRPSAVVFYGKGYRAHWEEIARARFAAANDSPFEMASNAATRFVLAPHPVATGVSNADFESIGKWLESSLPERSAVH